MPELLTIVDDLIRRTSVSGTLDDLVNCAANVKTAMARAPQSEVLEAQKRLAPIIDGGVHPLPMSLIAVTCGALVEKGGDPDISGPNIVECLPDMLAGVNRFLEICLKKAQADGERPDDEDRLPGEELVQTYFQAAINEDQIAGFIYMGHEQFIMAAIAHLTRSKSLRALARSKPEILEGSTDFDEFFQGGRSFLTKILLMLDDEPLWVLHVDQKRGYRISFSAIPDNFTLHTYLMGHLLGAPQYGLIQADLKVDQHAIKQAMVNLCDEGAPAIVGAFNLWNWTGLKPDKSLPTAMDESAFANWIWNEGVPADITPFEGERIVLLGPPPYPRSWPGGLIFGGLKPEFVVHETLDEIAVNHWLDRLSSVVSASYSSKSASTL